VEVVEAQLGQERPEGRSLWPPGLLGDCRRGRSRKEGDDELDAPAARQRGGSSRSTRSADRRAVQASRSCRGAGDASSTTSAGWGDVTCRLPEAGPAYIWQLNLGYRLPSQTNTSLFCAFCPHSCAPGKNFPVGHPSPNFSESSTLNLGVLSRSASGKEVATYWYEYPINHIKS
jgi:hypothetical protein